MVFCFFLAKMTFFRFRVTRKSLPSLAQDLISENRKKRKINSAIGPKMFL
jgi:hypothetical protein